MNKLQITRLSPYTAYRHLFVGLLTLMHQVPSLACPAVRMSYSLELMRLITVQYLHLFINTMQQVYTIERKLYSYSLLFRWS